MEIFKAEDYRKKDNPQPKERLTERLIGGKAKNLTGIFAVLPPGGSTAYHYHEKRESVLFIISGQAVEVVEGKKTTIAKDDVIFIPAGQKHGMVNESEAEVRYIEFQTGDPEVPDFVEVEKTKES